MSNNKAVIHIGLHKTGTTYLQEYVFPKLDGIFYSIGWRAFRNVFNAKQGQRLLISDEGISGNFKSGKWLEEFGKNMQIIKDLCGDPKIIIGFREHEKFLTSVYKQYLHEGGTEGFDVIFNKQDTGRIKIHEMHFKTRIEALKSEFSEVFIYNQADIQNQFPAFLEGLCQFLEIETPDSTQFSRNTINVGVRSQQQVDRLLKLNKWAQKMKQWPGHPNWYARPFQKLKLTPRHICQDRMKSDGPAWKLDGEISDFIRQTFAQDWAYTLDSVSYPLRQE